MELLEYAFTKTGHGAGILEGSSKEKMASVFFERLVLYLFMMKEKWWLERSDTMVEKEGEKGGDRKDVWAVP